MTAPPAGSAPSAPTARTGGPLPARSALVAGPLLRVFNDASILAAADLQVARRLGRLTGEADERVLLAVALAVRALRSGSVCVTLDDVAALAVPETDDATAVGPPPDLPWPDPKAWAAALAASPLVGSGVGGSGVDGSGVGGSGVAAAGPVGGVQSPRRVPDPPVHWVDGRLYLDRYWRDEQVVRAEVDGRLGRGVLPVEPAAVGRAVTRLFPDATDGRQRLAAATAALSRLSVVTGGPGTGKTTTVARLLAVLHAVAGSRLRVALAAPTGKAAARLQEAVRAETLAFDADDRRRVGEPVATTVHRLLGWKPGSSTRFAHDRDHRLPHDVVVVDETSMVSLSLMARLLEALRPDTRLVLVGDPDQLASVEAGAVLGDLVARPPVAEALPAAVGLAVPDLLPLAPDDVAAVRNGVVRLRHTYRFGGPIGRLADEIRAGRPDEVLEVLTAGHPEVAFVDTGGAMPNEQQAAAVRHAVERSGAAVVHAARAGDVGTALLALESHRLLLAHRRGPFGVSRWAMLAEGWAIDAADRAQHDAADDRPAEHTRTGPWYAGRPLIVTANDRETGLYNGDTGVLVADGGGLVAAFGDPQHPVLVRPHRLPPVETVYATTVHRGQGSQFRTVSVVLPPPDSPLLTRELLYTAVTRARSEVRVLGAETAVRAAVGRPVRRASGLRFPL